ncbi:MAG: hypothetical protein EBZ67_11960, partial [Chitinophagia bacterium]|nr:hypothetical protein [Chitinophagia bacterium]
ASATLGSSLQIHDALLLNAAQLDLAGQNLVLRSTATGTARVGDLTGSVLSGATNVTVERYIPQTLGTSNIGRRWRVLTSPIWSTTVNKAWQNSGTWNGTTPLSGSTNTLITGNRQGTAATANANGYDFWSSVATGGASICRYVTGSSQGAWGTIPGTLATGAFDAEKAYLLYIRGPRSSTYSTGTTSAPTTLQPTGTLKQGDINVTIAPNTGFTLVGNPYASPLDFDKVYDNPGNSGLIKRQFWVWDAALGDGGNYRLIKYMNGQYLSMPEGAPTTLTSIQSGQGFFVESLTTAGGTLKIFESDKTANAPTPVNVLLGHAGMPGLVVSLRRSEAGYGDRVMDEVISVIHNRYTVRPTDADDAAHPVDSDGHLAIRAPGRSISLDARPLTRSRDTLHLRLQNLPPGTYRFHVRMDGLGALLGQAWLRDAFAGELVPLRMDGGESVILFTVDAKQDSLYPDRFSLILSARTETVRMAPESEASREMRVWPNPVTGRSFHLQTPELPSGSYVAELYGIGGTLVWRKPWTHGGGGAVMRIDIPWGMPSGRYTIRVTGGESRKLHAELVVE